ncbi:hypothetical protein LV457_06080 [Mycobacterium sp. MYCO198283]|uniref:hypothetical protein n=1 Tax=Mycobacterium sp. MYCO198283 TaxID=2883505 RepID=UPI001E5AA6F3|nr:hypothetical protein [Mycobacterium sp. MYCO198283]MCG5431860.1 hypothetical protein [Mycobacterium sp. MYCO198283]
MATATTNAPDTATAPARPIEAFLRWYYALHPTYRLAVRWALILGAAGVAFHASIASVAETTKHGGIGGYVWTVPTAAALVAVGVARRHRTELPIHDRQTDIIVGGMCMVLALLIQGVLSPRYALYFHLLRLDLLAMWLFVVSCCIVLFGLRPVIRFSWVWLLLAMVFSLPYYLLVVFLDGGAFAAGAATLIIAGIATGIAVGRTMRRGLLGSLGSWAVGFAVLISVDQFFPDVPLIVYQQLPALSAICLVGMAMYWRARRGAPKKLLDRKVEPLAAKQVWAAVPLVVIAALLLAVLPLPAQVSTTPIGGPAPHPLAFGQALLAPPGWRTERRVDYPEVDRLYGDSAVLVRQRMVAERGDIRFDKQARPRTLIVDSIVARRPFAFDVYPARVLYGLTSARLSELRMVDLGHGVTARMLSVVDDDLLVTWNSIQFAWGSDRLAQRVTVLAVDNHLPDAPFPEPTTNLLPTVRTLLTLLFRGNAVLDERTPVFKDGELLTEFGRALVAAQQPIGAGP